MDALVSFTGSEPVKFDARMRLKESRRQKIEALQDEVVQKGRDAWGKRKSDTAFEDWLKIGAALLIGRDITRARSGHEPGHKEFNTASRIWLVQNPLLRHGRQRPLEAHLDGREPGCADRLA